MINPFQIINHKRTLDELLEFAIFAVCVAGRKSTMVAPKVDAFMKRPAFRAVRKNFPDGTYFDLSGIQMALREVKMGQYHRIGRAILGLLSLDLQTCTLEQLEAIPGIGPKTARFFLMFSRPKQEYAVLDVHVLRYIREELKWPNIPTATPSGKNYLNLEAQYVAYLKESGITDFAKHDLEKWSIGANKTRK